MRAGDQSLQVGHDLGRGRWRHWTLLGGLVVLVVLGMAWLGALARAELVLHDWFARLADARAVETSNPRIVIAGVSSARAELWQRAGAGGRRDLARLLDQLSAARARAVVIDVPLEVAGDDDVELASALARAGNVVLRARLTSPRPTEYALTLLPANLSAAAAASGYALWPADNDGVVRRMAVSLPRISDSSLAAATARVVGGPQPPAGAKTLLLRWAGPPERGFESRPVEAWLPTELANRIVVVGVTDVTRGGYTTPLARSLRPDWVDRRPAYMSSPELLANGLDTLLSGRWRRQLGLLGLVVLTVLGAIAGLTAGSQLPPRPAALSLTLGLLVYGTLAFALETHAGLCLPVAAPLAATLLGAVTGTSARAARRAARLTQEAEAAEHERQRLADLDRAKRAVLATIVHDLRNPVTVIKGQALTLLADPDMKLGVRLHEEFLQGISLQCDRLSYIVDDLLDIDPDRPVNLLVSPVALAAVVRRVAETHCGQSRRHTLELDVEDLGEVLVDENRFERILANLVSNAMKYSPKGGTVRVTLRGDREEGEFRVSVRDEGIGMRPDQVQRLFGLFVRVLDEPGEIPGAGVGLYSVAKLVAAHGGRLEVDSAPGQGSEFICILPWRTVDAGQPPLLDTA